MIYVCHRCGMFRADKIIVPSGPFAICPDCGYPHKIIMPPLMLISGASGTGKSALLQALMGRLHQVVLLESDILWNPAFNKPEDNYRDFFEIWLRMAFNISQSGKPVVIFGAGFGVPSNLESCIGRRYFTELHYLALVCKDENLAERLRSRPSWRGCGTSEFIAEQIRFNHWFIDNVGQTNPKIDLIDNTRLATDEAVHLTSDWILSKL